MGLYSVRIWTVVYVEAETESEAMEVMDDELQSVLRSDAEWEVETDYEVTALRDVRHGWDGDCFPYGKRAGQIRTINQVLEDA